MYGLSAAPIPFSPASLNPSPPVKVSATPAADFAKASDITPPATSNPDLIDFSKSSLLYAPAAAAAPAIAAPARPVAIELYCAFRTS